MTSPPEWLRLRLDIDVTPDQAPAFAQYLKRAGFSHYRQLAIHDEQAYDTQLFAERMRTAPANNGFSPR